MFIYVMCEVATVSQLCFSFPYVLHGLCEDYLTCDIAFNAVMPLSRASTRGRYSRIEGVTARVQICPSPAVDGQPLVFQGRAMPTTGLAIQAAAMEAILYLRNKFPQ